MNLFFGRPLALFCTLFAAATVCGCFLLPKEGALLALGIGLLAVVATILLLLLPKRWRSAPGTLAVCCMFAGTALILCVLRVTGPEEDLKPYHGSSETVRMTVLDIRYQYDYATSYLVQIDELRTQAFSEKAILSYEFDPEFLVGDILVGEVNVQDIRSYASDAMFYLSEGIGLYLEPAEQAPLCVGHTEFPSPLAPLSRLNRLWSDILTDRVGGEEGELLSSLLLGNQDLLSSTVMRNFKRAGIVHLLSISGMHLALMIALTEWLLRFLHIHKNIRAVAVLVAALFYLALTGFALSTVRAFIMAAFVYGAYLFRADNDPITSLLFALFLILTLSPIAVYDVGMWLSFSATLGILVTVELLRPLRAYLYRRISKKWLTSLFANGITAISVSFAASFCSFLPAWLFFDEISLLSVPATLILSPFATACLYITPFFFLLQGVDFLAGVLLPPLRFFSKALLVGTSLFSELEGCTVSLHYPFERVLLPVAAAATVLLLILPLRKKIILPTSTLCFTLVFFLCLGGYRYGHRDIWSADYVRNDDSEVLVLSDADTAILCDISSGVYSATYDAFSTAKDRYATEIHAYVLTHYHNRHMGTIRRLFEATPIHALYLPAPVTREEYYVMSHLLEWAEGCRISVTVYDRGHPVPIGQSLTLFVSEAEYLDRSAHPIGYVAVEANNKLLLYLGESVHESPHLASQIASLTDRADAVIFGLHGPVTKTPIPFDLACVPTVVLPSEKILLHMQVAKPPDGQWILHSKAVHFSFLPNH